MQKMNGFRSLEAVESYSLVKGKKEENKKEENKIKKYKSKISNL